MQFVMRFVYNSMYYGLQYLHLQLGYNFDFKHMYCCCTDSHVNEVIYIREALALGEITTGFRHIMKRLEVW